jgi:hypothetical protein
LGTWYAFRKQTEFAFIMLGVAAFFLPASVMIPLPTVLFALCQLMPLWAEQYPNEQLKQSVEVIRAKYADLVAVVAAVEVSLVFMFAFSILL